MNTHIYMATDRVLEAQLVDAIMGEIHGPGPRTEFKFLHNLAKGIDTFIPGRDKNGHIKDPLKEIHKNLTKSVDGITHHVQHKIVQPIVNNVTKHRGYQRPGR
jgi:hypothetical protein